MTLSYLVSSLFRLITTCSSHRPTKSSVSVNYFLFEIAPRSFLFFFTLKFLGGSNANRNAGSEGTHKHVQIVQLAAGLVPDQVRVPLFGLLGLLLQRVLGLVQLAVHEALGLEWSVGWAEFFNFFFNLKIAEKLLESGSNGYKSKMGTTFLKQNLEMPNFVLCSKDGTYVKVDCPERKNVAKI